MRVEAPQPAHVSQTASGTQSSARHLATSSSASSVCTQAMKTSAPESQTSVAVLLRNLTSTRLRTPSPSSSNFGW